VTHLMASRLSSKAPFGLAPPMRTAALQDNHHTLFSIRRLKQTAEPRHYHQTKARKQPNPASAITNLQPPDCPPALHS
jgi:hypothetical protein